MADSFLDILSKRIPVKWMNPRLQESHECVAQYSRKGIELSPHELNEELKEAVVHEVIHDIDYQLCLELDEDQVHALSSGLYHALRANPHMFAFSVKLPKRPTTKRG